MSDYFKVVSSTGEYGVHIGHDVLNSKIGDPAQQIIICDKFFASTYQALGLKVISIEAVETSKSLDQMSEVIIALCNLGANRNTTVLAIGGGVIQDIATFVASVYMRGLEWDYLPTTLLGMVDSCIGGKSSINVGKYKNLIGNFYAPENIYIDLQFLDTLSAEQKIAGLCEAVKICFAHTGIAFERYISLSPSATSSPEIFQELISLSLVTKRWFIEIDEHDHKERQLLNFGHTFGHAIEGAANFAIPHGIAVGMGMLAAIECARLYGHFTTSPARVTLLESYTTALLASIADLPLWTRQIAVDELMERFNADKKHTGTHYAVIVPDAAGHLIRLEPEKNDANRDLIFIAFRKVCQNTSMAV
jgi:3-dehydroquinate synthase